MSNLDECLLNRFSCDKAYIISFFPDNPRCPVKAYKLFKDKRPDEMRNADTPFYIGIGKNDKWFINQAMGKNTIAKLVKTMCDAAELPGKKSNHSLRRTAITTLVHAGVEPTVVQQLSGHKSIQSINNYSTASVNQQKNMSGIITEYTTGNDMNQMKEEVNETTSMNRSSQEEVENIIKEITSYENLQLEDLQTTNTPLSEQIQPVHSEYIPNSAYLSPNLNQNTFNKNSVTVFNRQSAPIRNKFPYPEYPGNILAGASISGNVTINMNIGKGRKRKVDEGPEYDSESE